MPTRIQTVTKWCIRLMMPVFVLAGLGGLSSMFLIGYRESQAVQQSWSPDRSYRATLLKIADGQGCPSSPGYAVWIERRWTIFKTGETTTACMAGPLSGMGLVWRGEDELLIQCHACDLGLAGVDEGAWGKLRIRYDLQDR